MILEDVLANLRNAGKGESFLDWRQANEAADAIEMLVEKSRYLEEKLAEEREIARREIASAEAWIRQLEEELGR